jgi:hypothetical protein
MENQDLECLVWVGHIGPSGPPAWGGVSECLGAREDAWMDGLPVSKH